MLQVKNLSIRHKQDDRELLRDFSLVLNEGDKAAVIGEEGNGKSTLLKLIYKEALVEEYVEYSGEIIRNNSKIGYLAQELSQTEKAMNVYDFMCLEPGFLEASPKELSTISSRLQLPCELFYADYALGLLSGGEKIKLQLGRILCSHPDVFLLDEPSNDLDLITMQWLERFIIDCRQPVLYISHDEVLLERTANKLVHIEQLRHKTQPRATVVKADYREYVDKRLKSMEHQEQLARKERSEYDKKMEHFRKLQQKVEHQQNVVSRGNPHGGRLLKKSMHRIKAYEGRFEKEFETMTELPESEDALFLKFASASEIPAGKKVLEYRLSKLIVGEKSLSKNINLFIKGSEKVCIIGRNGCGKTTLLRRIAAELSGREDIRVSYMPQNYEELLDFNMTPVEFLSQTGDKEETSRNRTYLGSMKFTADEMSHCIGDLSGGQKAKLFLLKMSISGSNVLILDEPTRNFSPLSNPVIRRSLREFPGAILSISHDRKYIEEVCDTVYELTSNGLEKREKLCYT